MEKIKIKFKENLLDFFGDDKFNKVLKNAKIVSKINKVVRTIIYNQNHTLIFTRDRKSIIVRFGVSINNKDGVFGFIIKLSDIIVNSRLDLTRGLCLIQHEDFEENCVYFVNITCHEDGNLILIDKKRKYQGRQKFL
jgi:hypothetical protein